MTDGPAVSLDAEVCAKGGVVETSVEVTGVLIEVVVFVAATGAVLCVVAEGNPIEPTVGLAEVVTATVSVPESLFSLGTGSACT